jgi:hypothetical protein
VKTAILALARGTAGGYKSEETDWRSGAAYDNVASWVVL